MYYCPDCGYEFETPEKLYETHGLPSPPYEVILHCPECRSTAFYEKNSTHCRCCGARLSKETKEYCSDSCRNKGEKLWLAQQRKRKLASTGAIGKIIKDINEYNRKNHTDYSYGQYVALIETKRRATKKCKRKKRNT